VNDQIEHQVEESKPAAVPDTDNTEHVFPDKVEWNKVIPKVLHGIFPRLNQGNIGSTKKLKGGTKVRIDTRGALRIQDIFGQKYHLLCKGQQSVECVTVSRQKLNVFSLIGGQKHWNNGQFGVDWTQILASVTPKVLPQSPEYLPFGVNIGEIKGFGKPKTCEKEIQEHVFSDLFKEIC
jgi:hypothetical protein